MSSQRKHKEKLIKHVYKNNYIPHKDTCKLTFHGWLILPCFFSSVSLKPALSHLEERVFAHRTMLPSVKHSLDPRSSSPPPWPSFVSEHKISRPTTDLPVSSRAFPILWNKKKAQNPYRITNRQIFRTSASLQTAAKVQLDLLWPREHETSLITITSSVRLALQEEWDCTRQ